MTTQPDADALRAALDDHIKWDVAEHVQLRKEHETDYRALVASINEVKIAVESGFNKVIMFLGGGILAGAVTIITTAILTHKP